jgi:hypothetical protein
MVKNEIRFTVDRVVLNRHNIIFTSLLEFGRCLPQLKRKRVFIFDSPERLSFIQGVEIYPEERQEYVYNFLLNNNSIGPIELPAIKVVKPIQLLIEKNKSIGILHDYNTLRYSITKKSTRDDIKDFVVNYVQGKVDIGQIDNLIKQTETDMRQSKMKDSLAAIFSLLKDEGFVKLKSAMRDLLKLKGQVDRIHIEEVALAHGVEPFDLNYFFSVIQKQKVNSPSKK